MNGENTKAVETLLSNIFVDVAQPIVSNLAQPYIDSAVNKAIDTAKFLGLLSLCATAYFLLRK